MKKNNFSERVLAFLLAFSMIFGVSFVSFADEYDSLNDRIANAENGSVITLDKDYIEDIVIPNGKNITIDLNGKTLSGTNASATPTIKVEKDAFLTIDGEGSIINNSTGNSASCIFNNGTVIIENGTIKKETGNKSYYNIANHGHMTINGGTIINDTPYELGKSHASLVENGYYDYTNPNSILGYVEGINEPNPSLIINGGTFDGGLNTIKNDDGATLEINNATVRNQIQVAVFNVSEATINGGTFEVPAGMDKTTVFNRRYNDDINKGKMVVNGGEFNADYFIEVINDATEADMGEIIINDGVFNTEKGLINTENRVDITTLTIYGGTFSIEPDDDKIADDIEKYQNESGEWIVGEPNEEASGEISGEVSGEVSGEASGEASEEISGELSGEVSGENNNEKENGNSSGHSSGGKKDDKEKDDENKSGEKEDEIKYSDVKDNDWFKEYIDKATKMKLVNGVGDNKYAPNNNITRGMIVTILYRYSGASEESDSSFIDVDKDMYYSKAIAWAEKNNIVNGVGDKKYAPDKDITREELATIIYRFVKYLKLDTNEKDIELDYLDMKEISEFALKSICWCTENNIIKGRENKLMAPKAKSTRAEATTMIVRLVELINRDISGDNH